MTAPGRVGRLLDIEGTVCPVSFVHAVLFPYARERMAGFLERRATDPEVARALGAVEAEAPGEDPLAALLGWMDADAKVTPLKALQGLIWRAGYADGTLVAPLYEDVVPALDRWRAAGEAVAVFSSGSVEAQRLLFAHTTRGDLTGRFAGFFDTTVGSKRDPRSYARIVAALGWTPTDTTFYSDTSAELDAARAAGLRSVRVARDEAGDDAIADFTDE